MGAFDRAGLHAVDHAEGRHQLAARVDRNLELAAGHLADLAREHLGGGEKGVERLREARRETPAQRGLRPNRGGRRARREDAGQSRAGGVSQEFPAFHEDQLPATVMRSTRMEPTCLEPRTATSLPMALMPANMSLRLPAMVISCTG